MNVGLCWILLIALFLTLYTACAFKMIPQGHTSFSWDSLQRIPFGHTAYTAGQISGLSAKKIGSVRAVQATTTAHTNQVEEAKQEGGGGEGQQLQGVLPAGVPLPSTAGTGFSVMSYNVLLPNSHDGWWIYKNYQKHVPRGHRAWDYRSSLLEKQLVGSNADIICIQEASGDSFEEDFDFMEKAGYGSVVHAKGVNKGRMRMATFFRAGRWAAAAEAHKYRVLVTVLKDTSTEEGVGVGAPRHVVVVNCHLTAGPNPAERLRQVYDGVDQARKEVNKLVKAGLATGGGEDVAVVVCGDFNSFGPSAVRTLLTEGEVTPEYREPNYPEVAEITSKTKKNQFKFRDAYEETYITSPAARPSTFYAPCLEDKFLAPSGELSDEFKEAVKRMFQKFSANNQVMTKEETEEWLKQINGVVGRGSEFRTAMACMEKNEMEVLTEEDLLSVYRAEVAQGKFWGVEHDFCACGVEYGEGWAAFRALFDYLYFAGGVELQQVQEPLSSEQIEKIIYNGDCIPNSWHPSDHLPISAVFKYTQTSRKEEEGTGRSKKGGKSKKKSDKNRGGGHSKQGEDECY